MIPPRRNESISPRRGVEYKKDQEQDGSTCGCFHVSGGGEIPNRSCRGSYPPQPKMKSSILFCADSGSSRIGKSQFEKMSAPIPHLPEKNAIDWNMTLCLTQTSYCPIRKATLWPGPSQQRLQRCNRKLRSHGSFRGRPDSEIARRGEREGIGGDCSTRSDHPAPARILSQPAPVDFSCSASTGPRE